MPNEDRFLPPPLPNNADLLTLRHYDLLQSTMKYTETRLLRRDFWNRENNLRMLKFFSRFVFDADLIQEVLRISQS